MGLMVSEYFLSKIQEQQQAAANDEAEEPFMGSGRFGTCMLHLVS